MHVLSREFRRDVLQNPRYRQCWVTRVGVVVDVQLVQDFQHLLVITARLRPRLGENVSRLLLQGDVFETQLLHQGLLQYASLVDNEGAVVLL